VSTAVNSPLVQQTADFVREQLKSNDASHDWRHIERVWTLARTLAKEEVRYVYTHGVLSMHTRC
jgi:uncharacterized protein